MTEKAKLIIKRYEALQKSRVSANRRWRQRHPEYERSKARRDYKRLWRQRQTSLTPA